MAPPTTLLVGFAYTAPGLKMGFLFPPAMRLMLSHSRQDNIPPLIAVREDGCLEKRRPHRANNCMDACSAAALCSPAKSATFVRGSYPAHFSRRCLALVLNLP